MIEKRLNAAGRVRWRVRHRTPDQRQRSRTFDRRRDAEDFEPSCVVGCAVASSWTRSAVG